MTSYIPTWTNKSTQSRTRSIIEWLESTVGCDSVELHSRTIRRIFGNSDLGRYLKNLLLVCVNPSYHKLGHNKRYRINERHLNRVRAHMGMNEIRLTIPKRIRDRFERDSETIESGDFPYREGIDSRSYNGHQYIPRRFKEELWALKGYSYDYDIRSCAPTLLLQKYYQLNPNAQPLRYLQDLIDHKDIIRSEFCIRLRLDRGQVKSILNALLLGAHLSHRSDNKILRILNHNHWLMRELRTNQFIINLIKDIRSLWRQLGRDIDRGVYYDCRGIRRTHRLSGSDKTTYYKHLETLVMNSLRKSFKKQRGRIFWEHDGFRSDVFFTPDELSEIIRSRTGYQVVFDWGKVDIDDDM